MKSMMNGGASDAVKQAVDEWSNFPMCKQGEWDASCGLYCLLAAFDHFEALHGKKILGRDGRQRREGLAWLAGLGKWDVGRLTVGPSNPKLRELGAVAGDIPGLRAKRLKGSALDAATREKAISDANRVHIVRVKGMLYPDPGQPAKDRKDDKTPHFLIVLFRVDDCFVVADSHPWIPDGIVYASPPNDSVRELIQPPARSPYHVYAIKENVLLSAIKLGGGLGLRLSVDSPRASTIDGTLAGRARVRAGRRG